MAFVKYAKASIRQVGILGDQWDKVTKKAGRDAFGERTSRVAIQNYSPDKYLLTHSTIVCSVDTEEPPNVKVGEVREGSQTINRKYANYWITPDSLKGINANYDAWERGLLLATYSTFIGAQNYLEHVQIPELSKGRIIDAVARDLGDHIYIDILTATDLKHTELVRDIRSGKMAAMSMGCTIQYSQCTKCGNVAVDEAELCNCVKYEKGNSFIRPDGKRGVIAELCGHVSDPSSVQFIEASWVENPAFKGAVTHHILNMGGVTFAAEQDLTEKIKAAHVMPSRDETDWTAFFQKTATVGMKRAMRQILLGEDATNPFAEDTAEDAPAEDAPEAPSGIEEMSTKLKEEIKSKALKELQDELAKEDAPRITPEMEEHTNENLVQSSQKFSQKYAMELGAGWKKAYVILKASQSPEHYNKFKGRFANVDILTAMYIYDRDVKASRVSGDIYTTLSKVGSVSKYKTPKAFLQACVNTLGRRISKDEAKSLIQKSKMLN